MEGPGVGDSVGYKSSVNLQSVPAKQTLPGTMIHDHFQKHEFIYPFHPSKDTIITMENHLPAGQSESLRIVAHHHIQMANRVNTRM